MKPVIVTIMSPANEGVGRDYELFVYEQVAGPHVTKLLHRRAFDAEQYEEMIDEVHAWLPDHVALMDEKEEKE